MDRRSSRVEGVVVVARRSSSSSSSSSSRSQCTYAVASNSCPCVAHTTAGVE